MKSSLTISPYCPRAGTPALAGGAISSRWQPTAYTTPSPPPAQHRRWRLWAGSYIGNNATYQGQNATTNGYNAIYNGQNSTKNDGTATDYDIVAHASQDKMTIIRGQKNRNHTNDNRKRKVRVAIRREHA
uniref:Uncharacterized protein n=1 Tax=Plectus sambesii TaxID=2011161 RepID=A0A914WWZ3_9BILA